MNTNQSQQKARRAREVLNLFSRKVLKLELGLVIVLLVARPMLRYRVWPVEHLSAWISYWWICALTIAALTVGGTGLLIARTHEHIRAASLMMVILCGVTLVWIPEDSTVVGARFGTQLLLAVTLLMFAGALVALMRNWWGSGQWIERHTWISAALLALAAGLAAAAKTCPTSFPDGRGNDFADVFAAFAAVGFGALFEKERIARKHKPKTASAASDKKWWRLSSDEFKKRWKHWEL